MNSTFTSIEEQFSFSTFYKIDEAKKREMLQKYRNDMKWHYHNTKCSLWKDETDDAKAPVESEEIAEETSEKVAEKKAAKNKTAKVEVDSVATEVAKDETDDTEAEADTSAVAKDDT